MASPPSDPGIRRSSSSLLALSAQCLPSPPITPSVSIEVSLNGSKRYSEIPIIFDFLTTSSKPAEERVQRMENLKVNLPPLAKFSPISAFFPMGDSTNSLNTFGQDTGLPSPASMTFNLAKDELIEKSRRSSAFASPLSQSTIADWPELPASSSAPLVRIIDFDSGQQRIGDTSTFTISAYLSSPSSSISGRQSNGLSSQSREDSMASFLTAKKADIEDDRTPTQSTFLRNKQEDSGVPGLRYYDKTPTRSTFRAARKEGKVTNSRPISILSASDSGEMTLSTMEFANLSLLSRETMNDDDITPTQSLFSKAQTNAHVQSQTRNEQEQASRTSAPVTISPMIDDDRTPTQSSFLKGQAIAQGCTINAQQVNLSGHSLELDDSSTTLSEGAIEQVPNLQHAKWLRDAVVELWIDQEGFREIRPQFHLASVTNGFTDRTHDLVPPEKTDPIFTTVAEFLPSSRTPHFFHHATLDRAPTLTRITVGGDQSKDYITRAATLSLRDNGVFFVDGTEDYRLEGENGPTVRLNWRFEYFISSRRPDGRSAHRGEKQLTPLSFSCTPALLHPLRANKVKVFHIMRKTLMPKIVAHKLEPPDLLPYQSHSSEDAHVEAGASVVSLPSGPEAVISSDIRASPTKASLPSLKSGKNILAKATARMRKGSISEPPPLPTSRTSSLVSQTPTKAKLRRGSVGEADRTASDLKPGRLSHKRPKSLDLSKVIGKGERRATSIAGPIVPHEELLKLLSKDPHPEIAARRVSARIQVVNNERVTVLPAPPRHR